MKIKNSFLNFGLSKICFVLLFLKIIKETNNSNFSGILKIKGIDRKIDILYEYDQSKGKFRIFTDETIFGEHIEIVFNKKSQVYAIKNYYNLKEKYLKERGKSTQDVDKTIEKFLEVK